MTLDDERNVHDLLDILYAASFLSKADARVAIAAWLKAFRGTRETPSSNDWALTIAHAAQQGSETSAASIPDHWLNRFRQEHDAHARDEWALTIAQTARHLTDEVATKIIQAWLTRTRDERLVSAQSEALVEQVPDDAVDAFLLVLSDGNLSEIRRALRDALNVLDPQLFSYGDPTADYPRQPKERSTICNEFLALRRGDVQPDQAARVSEAIADEKSELHIALGGVQSLFNVSSSETGRRPFWERRRHSIEGPATQMKNEHGSFPPGGGESSTVLSWSFRSEVKSDDGSAVVSSSQGTIISSAQTGKKAIEASAAMTAFAGVAGAAVGLLLFGPVGAAVVGTSLYLRTKDGK